MKTSFSPHSFELQLDLLLLNSFFGGNINNDPHRRLQTENECARTYLYPGIFLLSGMQKSLQCGDGEERCRVCSVSPPFALLNHAHAKRGRHSVNANRAREWAEGGLFSPLCVSARESSLIRPPPPSLDIHRETEANTDTCAKRGEGREERADRA